MNRYTRLFIVAGTNPLIIQDESTVTGMNKLIFINTGTGRLATTFNKNADCLVSHGLLSMRRVNNG